MNEARVTVDSQGRFGRWTVALLLVASALIAVSWRLAWTRCGYDLLSDDASYYTVTARNFAATGRFTFDGVSETNGFHPLWFWTQVAGFALFGTDADPMSQHLAVAIGVGVVFVLTIAGGAWLVTRPVHAPHDAAAQAALLVAVSAVLVPRFAKPYLGGMEAILVLPLLILTGVAAWKGRYAWAGLAAAALVMARLDTLPYVVFPIGLACAWREHRRGRSAWHAGLWMLGPATAATCLFMLFNTWYFGHPVPIHGVLKSCLPRIHLQWHNVFAHPGDRIALPGALASAAVGACLSWRRGRAGRDVRWLGFCAAALCLTQLAAFVLFQKWSKPVPSWYFGPAVLTGVFALAVGMSNTISPGWFRRLGVAAAIVALAANLASIGKAWYRGSLPWAAAHTATVATEGPGGLIEFVKSRPKDERFACTDCGKLAFWSGRSVVNLDGLINNFQYQDALRDGRLADYFRAKNVRYLIFLAWDKSPTGRRLYEPMYEHRVAPDVFSGDYDEAEFYVYSYRHQTYSDKVRLPRAAEVWRSAAAPDRRVQGKAVVFDLWETDVAAPPLVAQRRPCRERTK